MYQICISGGSKGQSVIDGTQIAKEVGKEVAEAKHILVTGATIGLPDIAAESYKNNNGHMSLGISPASSKVEHTIKYRLPSLAYDAIVYSGLHYVGRDTLLINSCDAVISIGGRIGTLHEFTIAVETNTPIGFVLGAGGISTEIKDILKAAGRRGNDLVVFGNSGKEVLEQLIQILDKRNKKYAYLYK